ncbi:MAG: helix-turn-helix transcriptional regulator [Gammaproteobacteria bacterium]|nr:helix-turn-helix transcriptional regulator [Gammaproteobacteria bacterium]
MDVRFDLRWFTGADVPTEIDPVLIAVLDAIADGGSLRHAAEHLRLSYRHAWGLLHRWEDTLGQPLVGLTRGRGAVLTAPGERLRWAWHTAEARLRPQLDSAAGEAARELAALFAPRRDSALRIAASHGLAIALLRDQLVRAHGLGIDLHYFGSVASLQRFRAGQCDAAGFHVPLGPLRARLAPLFARLLDPVHDRLIVVANREQGFITRPGQAFTGAADLARPGLRFVNRQPGSGSRLILDALLADAGVEPHAIDGYDNEEFTHLAVAAIVAGRAADVGFGLCAAARRFELDFVPVVTERYYLAVAGNALDGASVRTVLAALRTQAFRDGVRRLGGYDPDASGTVVTVQELQGV